jgi:hypothetical protein
MLWCHLPADGSSRRAACDYLTYEPNIGTAPVIGIGENTFDEYYRRTWVDNDGDISPAQTEFATSLRIPFLSSANPRWNHITGIVVCDNILDHGIVPTEDEVAVVAAHLVEYRNHWFNQSFQRAMAHFAPYDIDGGANLGYYMKRPDGRWAIASAPGAKARDGGRSATVR